MNIGDGYIKELVLFKVKYDVLYNYTCQKLMIL
jgi:hypothetical protein